MPDDDSIAASQPAQALELPDLQDTILDSETLARLFFDLSQLATILDVRVKGAALAHAREGGPNLDAARALLQSGSALGVQLRYLHKGSEWIDTLLRTPHGVRLVRMQVPPRPAR